MKKLLSTTLLGIALIACQEKKQESVIVNENKTTKELSTELDSLNTNMVTSWDTMIMNDDLKMSSIKRMIQELSFIDGSNKDSVALLDTLYEGTKAARYERERLTNAQIEAYDLAQEILLSRVYGYSAIVPQIEKYPMMLELQIDITKLDQEVVFLRSGYDNYALFYNDLLKNFPVTLAKLKPKYSTLQTVGVFTIIDDSENIVEEDSLVQ